MGASDEAMEKLQEGAEGGRKLIRSWRKLSSQIASEVPEAEKDLHRRVAEGTPTPSQI